MLFTPLTEFRESYLIALGQIVYAMGHLEEGLATLMRTIADNMEIGNFLVVGCHLDKVLDMLSAAFYSSPQRESESITFEYLLGRVRDVNEARNDNIHAQWFFREDTQQAYRIKLVKHKRGIISTRKVKFHIPLSELEQLQFDIFKLIDDIEVFRIINFLSQKTTFPPEELKQYKELYDKQVKAAIAEAKKRKK